MKIQIKKKKIKKKKTKQKWIYHDEIIMMMNYQNELSW